MLTNERLKQMWPLIIPKLQHHIPNIDRFYVPLSPNVEAAPFSEDQLALSSTNSKYEYEQIIEKTIQTIKKIL